MRVFVAGSSGVLGRAVVRQLCARGHEVIGLVRSEGRARVVSELGGQPVVGDILDARFLRQAVRGCDVVMHLATAIPKKNRPEPRDWELNDRVRREGTHNLIEAVRDQPLHAYIQQSIAFLYGDRRNEWIREDERPKPNSVTQSAVDAERMVLDAYTEWGLPGVILRGATFYDAEAWHTRTMLNAIKRRQFAVVGSGEQYWHYVYVPDMAFACVLAAETPAPGEIFFVADDWPFHSRDLIDFLAVQLNAPAAPRISPWMARLIAGHSGAMLAQSARYRTDKIKRMIGWTPHHPTFREGFAEILLRVGARLKL